MGRERHALDHRVEVRFEAARQTCVVRVSHADDVSVFLETGTPPMVLTRIVIRLQARSGRSVHLLGTVRGVVSPERARASGLRPGIDVLLDRVPVLDDIRGAAALIEAFGTATETATVSAPDATAPTEEPLWKELVRVKEANPFDALAVPVEADDVSVAAAFQRFAEDLETVDWSTVSDELRRLASELYLMMMRAHGEIAEPRRRAVLASRALLLADPQMQDTVTIAAGQDSVATVALLYRRADRWHAGRLLELGRERSLVAAGCPPAPGERIAVELREMAASGGVARTFLLDAEVEPPPAGVAQSAFSARWRFSDVHAAQRFLGWWELTRARFAGLSPPPVRRDARYPLAWPVLVDGSIRHALDISARGLFVSPLPDGPAPDFISVSIALDDGGRPIDTAARVARVVSAELARERGIPAGYGLELSLSGDEEARYQAFVRRVSARASRHVVVVAAADRLARLREAVAAPGYLTLVAHSPSDVLAHAGKPDAAVVDRAFFDSADRIEWVEQLLQSMSIPVIRAEGLAPTGVTALLDGALCLAS